MAEQQPRTVSTSSPFRSPVTVEDLMADLVWPRLLRSAALAFHPARLGLGFLAFVVIMIGLQLVPVFAGDEAAAELAARRDGAVGNLVGSVLVLHSGGTAAAVIDLFIRLPAYALQVAPIGVLIASVLMILALAVGGGAISRMAASEFAVGMSLPWPQAVAFAIRRLGSLVGAMLGPAIVVWLVAVLLAVGGLLLAVPVLNVIGAILYPLALLLGLVGVLVMVAFVLGHPLLIPAVACDGSDAIDAIQRAYAYVFGKPLRLVGYILVLLLLAVLILFVVWVIAWGVLRFTETATGAIAGPHARSTLAAADATAPDTLAATELGSTAAAAAWIIRLWATLVLALAWGYVISFSFCAATLLYLAMRRVVDGQDMHEIWMPGMVAGAAAEAAVAEAPAPGEPRKEWVE